MQEKIVAEKVKNITTIPQIDEESVRSGSKKLLKAVCKPKSEISWDETGTIIAVTPEDKKRRISLIKKSGRYIRKKLQEQSSNFLSIKSCLLTLNDEEPQQKSPNIILPEEAIYKQRKKSLHRKSICHIKTPPSLKLEAIQDFKAPSLRRYQERYRRQPLSSMTLRIRDRFLSAEVRAYIVAAFHVLATNSEIYRYIGSHTIVLPKKFLIPLDNGRMIFANRQRALEHDGVSLQISLQKKCPHEHMLLTLQRFIEKYQNASRETVLKAVDKNIFNKLCKIFKAKRSDLYGVFNSPYRIQEGYNLSQVMLLLQKLRRANPNNNEMNNFITKFIVRYRNKAAEKFSRKTVSSASIKKIARYLPGKYRRRLFVDIRSQLPVHYAVNNATFILDKLPRPHYNLRMVTQLLSNKPTWTRSITPAISAGIINIQEEQLQIVHQHLLYNFLLQYRAHIEDLATGYFAIKENARDLTKKNQAGTQTQELQELLLPFAKLQELTTVQTYPQIDGRIRATAIIDILIAVQLLVLAVACLFSGSLRNILALHYGLPEYSDGWLAMGISSSLFDFLAYLAASWAIGSYYLSRRILQRSHRKIQLLHVGMWFCFCLFLLALGGILGYLHLPWLGISAYVLHCLSGKTTAAHFYPEFGFIQAKVSAKAIWVFAMAILTSILVATYCIAIACGYIDNGNSIVGNLPLMQFLHWE